MSLLLVCIVFVRRLLTLLNRNSSNFLSLANGVRREHVLWFAIIDLIFSLSHLSFISLSPFLVHSISIKEYKYVVYFTYVVNWSFDSHNKSNFFVVVSFLEFLLRLSLIVGDWFGRRHPILQSGEDIQHTHIDDDVRTRNTNITQSINPVTKLMSNLFNEGTKNLIDSS
jgi:hypothetical protein